MLLPPALGVDKGSAAQQMFVHEIRGVGCAALYTMA